MHTITPDSVLTGVRQVLAAEGQSPDVSTHRSAGELLTALAAARDIQTPFFAPASSGTGSAGKKLKSMFTSRLRNIIINVLERTVLRQQKFNELTYQTITELQAQIDELRSRR